MNNNDKQEFLKVLIGLGELYAKNISESLIEIYWSSLEKFDFKSVKSAIKTHVNNPDCGQFFPKPADVVRYIEGSTKTQGLQAWTKVRHAVQRIGHSSTVIFDDAIIHAVISDMGGWQELCGMLEKEVPFKSAEFEKRYSAYVINPPINYPKRLIGEHEQRNSANGFIKPDNNNLMHLIAPTVIIGDEKKALEVQRLGSDGGLKYRQISSPVDDLKLDKPKMFIGFHSRDLMKNISKNDNLKSAVSLT